MRGREGGGERSERQTDRRSAGERKRRPNSKRFFMKSMGNRVSKMCAVRRFPFAVNGLYSGKWYYSTDSDGTDYTLN